MPTGTNICLASTESSLEYDAGQHEVLTDDVFDHSPVKFVVRKITVFSTRLHC